MKTNNPTDEKTYNYKAFAKAARPLITQEQVYGITSDKDKIIELIKKINLERALITLSQFSAAEDTVVQNIKSGFLESINSIFGINTEKNKDEILFASQAVLYMYKWLLAYGEKTGHIEELKPYDGTQVLHLFLQISDFLPKEVVFNSYLFHVLSFSKDTNLGTEIGRSFYIFTELAKKKELYKPNEFLDFNADFLNKYGYSIEEYLAVTFGLLNLVLPQPIPLNTSWIKSRHKLFRNSKLKEVAPKIIQDLSLDMDEAKEWSQDTIDNSWNFTKFQEKPLLKLNQEEFIPLNYDVLANGLFDGLYHKIRHCYPLKDTRFPTFFGKPFEKYIEVIIEEAINNSRLPYNCIHEFNYGGKNNTLSSDLYLQLNKDLIIFEAKGARPTINSIINGIKDSIQNDLKKLYIKPILQANNTFENILKTKYSTIFDGVENIYIISVNINNIPPVPDLYTIVDENLKGQLHPKVKGYFNFSISDIEAMCYLIARKGKKPSIFKYLNRKFNSSEIQSFSWFLHHSHIPVKRSPWINQQLYKSYESLYNLSFENTEESLKDLKKKLLKD